ncbi:MAG: hypothetical protein NW218_11630 [Saprospiraceae bacterium]|nr:hypothetical protein [Saprospiraceae bacterium]
MKTYILAVCLLLGTAPLFAQFSSDVLRYSYLQPGGTARFMGAGGAFTALGAEFSTLSQNPAGLAFYRSSELTLTPALYFAKTDATLPNDNVSNTDSRSNFGFDNFGLVFNTTPSGPKWKTFNVGIGLNRMNSFQQSVFYEGTNAGSIVNKLFDNANETLQSGGTENDFDPFFSGLAYKAGGLYFQDNVFTSDFEGNRDAVVTRSQQVNTYGRMNELVLSFAGNYDEKLMVGVTVGVPIVNYRLESEYLENDNAGLVQYFDDLSYTDYLRTEGFGINGKFGLVYKVSQALRLGAAFHTPTLLGLTDTYSNTFSYTFTDNDGQSSAKEDSPEGKSDYKLRTPWRAMAGASLVVKKFTSFSADIEVVDYSANNFNLTADNTSVENQQYERDLNREVQRAYKQAINLRFGTQISIANFRIRGGVNMLGKPEENQDGFNMAYSGGLGVRGDAFYIDLGYQRYLGNGSVQAYASAPVANTETSKSNIVLTLGLKF